MRYATLALVVLLSVLVVATSAPAQTKDDTVVYALQSDTDSWDPPASVLREAIILGNNLFDALATRDLKTLKVIPRLATSWKPLNETTWEVKLRKGVRFHDGTPFSAKDVKATFDRVLDPKRKMIARGNHAKIKSVEILDDYTVRFHTDGPYPLFVERMTALPIESAKVIQEHDDTWMAEHPVGTGPWKLVYWKRKQEHLLQRNDDYWGPKPAFKYLRVRIIPEQATQIAELLAGTVDIIKAVPPDQMDVINKSGTSHTATSPILRTAFLQFDQAGRGGKNPFQDRRVRLAANLAVDIDAIIKFVLNGLGDRAPAGVNPMAFGFDKTVVPYKQDLARAKKLLAEAGYPNGVDVKFNEAPPVVEPGLQQTNDAIVSDMTKAGFRVHRNYVGDNTVVVARVKDGTFGPMFNWSWGYYSVFDADAILYDNFKCGEYYSYYCNKELDQLILAGRSTLDEKKREEVYSKAQHLLYDDAAYLFKWGLRGVWGISNRVDYAPAADEVDRMFLVTPKKK